jgi:hypothetical protein
MKMRGVPSVYSAQECARVSPLHAALAAARFVASGESRRRIFLFEGASL